jgi:CRISPR-associated protein Cmr1
MIEWTALGAKAQMGFGVMQPISDRLDANVFLNCIKGIDNNHNSNYLPSLQNIFLAKIQLQNANDRDIFDLKYDLRQLFAVDDNLRHFIMGTIKGQRTASKIKVSRPYDNGLIRVWGWIPEKASVYSEKWNRESILQCIYGHLDSYYSLKVWREMSSVRDKVDKNQEDPRIFLKSLLKVAVSE